MIIDCPVPPEKESFIVAHTPDWRGEPELPIYIHDWPELLAQARRSLASRRETYPEWVKRDQLTQAEADADIQAWEWLVAEWHWVITGEGEPPPADSIRQRRAAVQLSLQRIDNQLRRGNRTHDIFRQAHLAMALAWHLDSIEFGAPQIHFVARLNHNLRAQGRGHLEFLAA